MLCSRAALHLKKVQQICHCVAGIFILMCFQMKNDKFTWKKKLSTTYDVVYILYIKMYSKFIAAFFFALEKTSKYSTHVKGMHLLFNRVKYIIRYL